MGKEAGRKRPSASLTELVDRAADTASELGDRAAETLLKTIDVAANALSPVHRPDEVRAIRRRNTTGGATRRVAEAAAKTNRKLARSDSKPIRKPGTTASSTTNRQAKTQPSQPKTAKPKR